MAFARQCRKTCDNSGYMLLWLTFALVSASGDSALKKELKTLEGAFDDTEFETVTAHGGRLLKSSKLKTADKKRVLELVAFSYFYLNKKAPAEATLRDLFALD